MPSVLLILLLLCIATCIAELLPLIFFKNRKKLALPVLISNVISNPILNLIYPSVYYLMYFATNFTLTGYFVGLIILFFMEVGVVFFETYIYKFFTDLPFKKRLTTSIILNAVSFSIGIFLQVFFDILIIF